MLRFPKSQTLFNISRRREGSREHTGHQILHVHQKDTRIRSGSSFGKSSEPLQEQPYSHLTCNQQHSDQPSNKCQKSHHHQFSFHQNGVGNGGDQKKRQNQNSARSILHEPEPNIQKKTRAKGHENLKYCQAHGKCFVFSFLSFFIGS